MYERYGTPISGVSAMTRRFFGGIAVVVAVALCLGLVPAVAFGVADPVEAQVTSDPSHQLTPSISGDVFVWKDFRNGNYDIYGYDMSEGAEFAVCTDPSLQLNPDVSGTKVVWQDFRNGNWDIYLYDLATGVETQLTSDPAAQQNPAISGRYVAWEDFRNGNWDIYAYDLQTGTEIQVTDEPARQRGVDVSGSRVVWEDLRNGNWDVYLYDLSTGQEQPITGGLAQECQPDVAGDKVAYHSNEAGNWDIYVFDIAADEVTRITDEPETQTGARLAAGAVVWQDFRNGNWDIYLYDFATGAEKQITSDPASQWAAESDGGDIVWEDHRNGNGDIYMARIQADVGRSAGDDRYDTASTGGTAWTDGAQTVVIATGQDYADALSASGLAGALDAALLLTRPDALPDSVALRIQDLGAQNAIIVGGPRAVSEQVESDLEDLGLAVSRVAGANRYETAQKVGRRMASILGDALPSTGFVVRGDGFADALAVSPYAYNMHMPVVLTRPDALPAESRAEIRELGLTDVVIAGGPRAVNEKVEEALGLTATRVNGSDRYETAAAVAEYAAAQGWGSWAYVGLATGADFADALAGGAVTGWNGGVLLLTEPDRLSPPVKRALRDRVTGIETVQVFGGPNAVGDQVVAEVQALW
ncbi:MAG: hypothetical protein Kow0056_13030 [Coriobacteriia bacterium]